MDESREAVVVLDDDDRVVLASRRARQTMDGIREGELAPPGLLTGERGVIPLVVPYEVDGRRERLVYLSRKGDLAAYEELRSGFTAAVSHELRTPLARLLTLLETASLPGEDVGELLEQAAGEVHQITELIDEVLFLSELESGARVVALGEEPVHPVLAEALDGLEERAGRAGVELRLECDPSLELAIRPRMLLVVARNLAENAIRYAGPGTTFTLAAERLRGRIGRARRPRRRRRGRRSAAAEALRALLPRRQGAGVPRNGPRARDRQARRDAGRRHCRGPRSTAAAVSRSAASSLRRSRSPDFHRIFTKRGPRGRERTARLTP